jgi:VanZ family protein
VCWATVDEIHQSFSASRGASATDVLLDSMGAAFGLLVYHFWLHRKSR